jgi:carbamoyltransferase
MVLNTSFNVKGQPIVNTPAEALETFLRTGIEFLFLENTLVSRPR